MTPPTEIPVTPVPPESAKNKATSAATHAAFHATLDGLLGQAVTANRRGRLTRFIRGAHSPAIALFARDVAARNTEGDWYGEHAGKWLSAAARAAARAKDPTLTAQVHEVADFLAAQQEPDGYLGNSAPSHRFTQPQPPKPLSWDGAPARRTWDIWTHSYLILGLVEAWRQFGTGPDGALHSRPQRWLEAACRIGDLCHRALSPLDQGGLGLDITDMGNHHGLSATVLLDPACELYFATGQQRYLDLAERILAQADAHLPLALLSRALAGADAAEIATGKAYQLAWNLVGLAKLHRATGRAELRQAVDGLWTSIRDRHLSLGGGPWGGVAHRSREVFNAPGSFSPQAYVETCSTLAWLQLNRELLLITGQPRYAEEIERTAYNDLLGAMAPNGEDWCYYSFPNGRRVHTTYWRCCKSSGALAVEELPALAYGVLHEPTPAGQGGPAKATGIAVQVYGPSQLSIALDGPGQVRLSQHTGYPLDGAIRLVLDHIDHPDQAFTLRLRIPSWAQGATLLLNGLPQGPHLTPGENVDLHRAWQAGDELRLHLPMLPRLHRQASRNIQESRAPDGRAIAQQVLCHEYVAFTRGPLVYATGLIDGFKTEETLRLPGGPQSTWLLEQPASDGGEGTELQLQLGYRAPLLFQPYYRAGGREDGRWRLTWLSLAPSAAPATPQDALLP